MVSKIMLRLFMQQCQWKTIKAYSYFYNVVFIVCMYFVTCSQRDQKTNNGQDMKMLLWFTARKKSSIRFKQ